MTVDEAAEREAELRSEVLRRGWGLDALRRGSGLERWHAYVRAHTAWVESRRLLDRLAG